jgi:hypothetical protein
MSVEAGPNEVTDGLIFCIDERNTKKSWIGPPITNQFLAPTPAANGDVVFAVNGTGIFKRITSGNYGGYNIDVNDIVYRYDLGVAGCHYHGNTVAVPSGVYVTWTFDYYISPDAANLGTANYLANVEGPGSLSIALLNLNKGVWQSIKATSALTTSSGNSNILLYPGACSSSYLASSGYILYKNPQVTFTTYNPTVGVPFVNGTRSNTESLKDLTNRTTVTANSLTYNSNGTFSFAAGTTAPISLPLSTSLNKSVGSINMWVYPTSYNGANGLFINRDSATENALDWLWLGMWSTGSTIYFRLGDGSSAGGNDLTITGSNLPVNTWTNICATWASGGTSAIYINGVLINSRAIAAIPGTNPTANGTIGLGHGSGGTASWIGEIEYTGIYNVQLTATQVKQNFDAIRGRYGI